MQYVSSHVSYQNSNASDLIGKTHEDVDAIDIHPDVFIVGTCTTQTYRQVYLEIFIQRCLISIHIYTVYIIMYY